MARKFREILPNLAETITTREPRFGIVSFPIARLASSSACALDAMCPSEQAMPDHSQLPALSSTPLHPFLQKEREILRVPKDMFDVENA